MKDLVFLDRDVAVRAVNNASFLKTPTVVCHAFDCRLVLAREGHAHKNALIEHTIPDASHRIWDYHAC